MLSHATKVYYLKVNPGAMFLLVKSGQRSYIWFRDFILVVPIVFRGAARFVKASGDVNDLCMLQEKKNVKVCSSCLQEL